MIHDFEDAGSPDRLDADICIIGSGAAGLALAEEFLGNRGVRVVMLESGGWQPEPNTQLLYESVVSGMPSRGINDGRFRIFGGSTTQWAGQALPMMPMDFEAREWVPESGWPISYAEVGHYYPRAARFLKLDQWNFDDDLFRHLPAPRPGFDPAVVWQHFSKWSPQPNLSSSYKSRLVHDPTFKLVLHANVIDLRLDADGHHLETVHFRTLGGRAGLVRTKVVVLCAGGVETARLLLACRSQKSTGLGNEHDQVGRYFQDHPFWRIGVVKPADLHKVLYRFSARLRGRARYTPRLTLQPEYQRKMQILNACGYLAFEALDGNLYESIRWLAREMKSGAFTKENAIKITSIVPRGPEILKILAERFLWRREYITGAEHVIHVVTEQAPDPSSRIKLHPHRADALGMPLTDVHWRLGELQNTTIRAAAAAFAGQFLQAEIGTVDLAPWLKDPAGDWRQPMSDFNHHIGACRMSASPSRGVVDAHCRVHSIKNLYLAGSAVFPTGGHSNPTYTIIALAKRLADHLKRLYQSDAI